MPSQAQSPSLPASDPIRCAPVRLETELPEDNAPRWIQVAEAGEFHGHPSGPFQLTAEVFGEIIKNFRNHPDYDGHSRILAFDVSHASESSPGVIAVQGAPAHAWALDLEQRTGPDGAAELWALTEYLEPMRSYVREGRYRWCSVAIWPDAKDPQSGQSVGWYLSSIAFTNDPFIKGMVPIAATRSTQTSEPAAKAGPEQAADDAASTPRGNNMADVKLLKLMAERFGIPATEDEVQRAITLELDKGATARKSLRALLAALGTDDADAGVDKIANLLKQADDLKLAMPQLKSLAEANVESEEKSADEDVEEAMKAHRMPDSARFALEHMRTGGIELDKAAPAETISKALDGRRQARARFLEKYPPVPAGTQHLQQQLATTPSPDAAPLAGPLRNMTVDHNGQVVAGPACPAPGPGAGDKVLFGDIEKYPGRNIQEKAMAHVKGHGGENLSFEACHEQASLLLQKARGLN